MIACRPATRDDLDAIARVHVQVHQETYVPLFGGEHPATPKHDQRHAQWAAYLARGDDAFVARDNDDIIGIAHAEAGHMTTLYVLATYHRRGVGRALMNLLRATLAERGIAEITFNVLALNTNAIAFYEAQGARQLRREIVEEPEGPTEDIVFAIRTR